MTKLTKRKARKDTCDYCAGGPAPGWIETDNNGPIVSCPICNSKVGLEGNPNWRRGSKRGPKPNTDKAQGDMMQDAKVREIAKENE